jgi:DNA-binding PadR family transcriptional regulator
MQGFAIVKTLGNRTQGCCSPTEGTLHPVLREFESGALVRAEEQNAGGGSRKVYTLTEKGRGRFRASARPGTRSRGISSSPPRW